LWTNIEKEKRDDYTPCADIVDAMKAVNDPRLGDYFQLNKYGEYVGVPFGITQGQVSTWNRDTLSRFGESFIKQNSPAVLISASYMNLTVAEAAELGWVSANAEQYYKDGIRTSMTQRHKYEDSDFDVAFDTFYSVSDIAYTGDTNVKINKIAKQKWIANYMQDGMEAWSEWRRSGVPTLGTGNSSEIPALPRRRTYAADDYVNSIEAYDAAIAIQGADAVTTRVWWDKE